MFLVQIILRKIKYYIFLIKNILSDTRKYNGYNSLLLNNSIIKKTLAFNYQKLFIEKDINIKRTLKFINYIKKKKTKKNYRFWRGGWLSLSYCKKNN